MKPTLWPRTSVRGQRRFGDHPAGTTKARDSRGASAVEYGLLIAGIAALISVAVFAFANGPNGLFKETCSELTSKTIQIDDCD